MKEEEINKWVNIMINNDYSETTFTTTLFDTFGKRIDDIAEYIKTGREFWHYDDCRWRKLKVTYIRSGVMFFTFEDELIEKAMDGVYNCVGNCLDWVQVEDAEYFIDVALGIEDYNSEYEN